MNRPVPVHVVEPHHHALYHIYRAIGRKKLPFSNLLLVHLDAHPDLVLPPGLQGSRSRDREHVLDTVDIESWILPAALAGHLDRILWVRSPWSKQIPDGEYHFVIGEKGDRAKVSCPLPYFLSECLWAPSHHINQPNHLSLKVAPLNDLQSSLESPWAPDGSTFILDIDLDFYSTQDPFAMVLTSAQMATLCKLYNFDWPQNTEDWKLVNTAQEKREKQLHSLKAQLECLLSDRPIDNDTTFDPELQKLCQSLKERPPLGEPLEAQLIHDAGCTCDLDSQLPHNVSSRKEIAAMVQDTAAFLKQLGGTPALVTVARSSLDGYCPPKDVDFVQAQVLDMLAQVYGNVQVQLDYEEPPSDP